MYIVIGVEHTNTFDDIPIVLGKFDTLEKAKEFRESKILESLVDFPDEKRDGNFLYIENKAGLIDYGYVLTIVEI